MLIKPKVAFVISNLNSGGAERVVSNLANELINSFDITIILLYKCEPFYFLDERISITYCLENYNPKPSIFESLFNHLRLLRTLRRILCKRNINICIGFMTTSNIHVAVASKLIGIPSIISERANPNERQLSPFWDLLRKLSYKYANVLIVQTELIKKYFENFIESEKIIVIKNPIATTLCKEKDLLTPKENIILNVGRLNEGKNQDLLIKAFSNIENTGWKIVLVGDGPSYDYYKKLISSLKLQEKISLVGNVPNVAYYYNKAKIFAFTSKNEGFPNALMEAMHFGLACISTDCPTGPSEIIRNDNNGFLIPVGNQKELEHKLIALMRNDELQQKFSRNAMNSTSKFLTPKIGREWVEIINKILVR